MAHNLDKAFLNLESNFANLYHVFLTDRKLSEFISKGLSTLLFDFELHGLLMFSLFLSAFEFRVREGEHVENISLLYQNIEAGLDAVARVHFTLLGEHLFRFGLSNVNLLVENVQHHAEPVFKFF